MQVRQAANQVEEQQAIFISAPQPCSGSPAQIAELIEARLPYGAQQLRRINLAVTRGQRIALTGPNGCGKSTLLKVLAGQLTVVSGQARTLVTSTYLDQHLGVLEPAGSVLEQLQSLNRQLSEGELRTRLAQLGLNADRINLPSHRLSGGERLKAAMACVFYTQSPPQLLLLDEPANHLDLPSVQALESMLKHYPGTLIVTSHDDVFLAAIGITHRLMASPTGWLLCPV